MVDSLVCGSCGRAFLLSSLNQFIEHKAEGCNKMDVLLPRFLECYHCEVCTVSPTDLIMHVQSVHGINISKDFGNTSTSTHWAPQQFAVNATSKMTKHVSPTKPYTKSITDNRFTEQDKSYPNRERRKTAESGGSTSNWLTPESNSDFREETNLFDKPAVRRTCCLVDGGTPCDQITSCPILNETNSNCDLDMPCPNTSLASNDFPLDEIAKVNCKQALELLSVKCAAQTFENSHDARQRFSCVTCSRSFSQKVHLQKHIISKHSHNMPFKCTQCEYQTVESSHLKAHFRRHTGERPFSCLQCSYKAAQHSTLKQHCMRKHKNAFVHCHSCSLYFVTLTELERHKKFCEPTPC